MAAQGGKATLETTGGVTIETKEAPLISLDNSSQETGVLGVKSNNESGVKPETRGNKRNCVCLPTESKAKQ